MKKYINAILSIASVGMLFYIILDQKQQIKTLKAQQPSIDSLHKVIDSLNGDILIKNIDIGRYESIFDRAEGEMTPECKDELEAIRKTVE